MNKPIFIGGLLLLLGSLLVGCSGKGFHHIPTAFPEQWQATTTSSLADLAGQYNTLCQAKRGNDLTFSNIGLAVEKVSRKRLKLKTHTMILEPLADESGVKIWLLAGHKRYAFYQLPAAKVDGWWQLGLKSEDVIWRIGRTKNGVLTSHLWAKEYWNKGYGYTYEVYSRCEYSERKIAPDWLAGLKQ